MNNKVTPKQRKFCEEYIIDLNATKAYLRTYKVKNEEVAKANASRMLTNANVQAAIKRLIEDRSERTEIKQDDVVKKLATIAFSNITDFLSIKEKEIIVGYEKGEDGNYDYTKPVKEMMKVVEILETEKMDQSKVSALSEAKQTKDGISIKMYDKLKALELLGRHLGMFKDNVNISGNINIRKLEDYF